MGARLLFAVTLALSSLATVPPSDSDDTSAKRRELRAQAKTIVDDVQSLAISGSEARRRVELLRQALRSWAKDAGLELDHRSRTYTSPPKGKSDAMTADNCPLFFKDDIEDNDDVCPLDLSRSEVWGASVMFCRYDCAPKIE